MRASALAGEVTGAPLGRPAWWALLAAVLGVTLCAGLFPFELAPENDVRLGPDSLHFGARGGRGIALAAEPLRWEAGREAGAFTIAAWLRPDARSWTADDGVARFPLTLDDGRDPPLLRLGQHRDNVSLDWRERRAQGGEEDGERSRHLGRSAAFAPGRDHFVAIVSGEGGTRIHVDGSSAPGVTTGARVFPADTQVEATLLLGSDAEGERPWSGTMRGVAVLPRALDRAELAELAATLGGPASEDATAPRPRYALAWIVPGPSEIVPGARDVLVPTRFAPPRPRLLSSTRRPPALDAVVNFFGFTPFGAALALRPGRRRILQVVALAILASGLLSLGIELAQVAMPARDSSLFDLVLNTAGGGAGAGAVIAALRARAAPS